MKKIFHEKDLLEKIKDTPSLSDISNKFPPTTYFICEGCEEVHYLNELTSLSTLSNSSSLFQCAGKKYLTGQITGTGFVTHVKHENDSVSVEWFCEADLFKKAFPGFGH